MLVARADSEKLSYVICVYKTLYHYDQINDMADYNAIPYNILKPFLLCGAVGRP